MGGSTKSAGERSRRDPIFRAFLIGAGLFLLAAKVWYARVIAVDSDEPQHLHIVWAWTQGMLPYRDVFDNHTPLFHLLMAPLLALLGEREDAVLWMRLPMIAMWLGIMYLCWRIGARLFDRSVALTAVALLAIYPSFFIVTSQFRTDNLWCLLWMLAFALLLEGAFISRRAALAGLIAGAALATSMKTMVLLGSLAGGALVIRLLQAKRGQQVDLTVVARGMLAFAAGFLVVPGLFALFFLANGAGAAMINDVWQHNMIRPHPFPTDYAARVVAVVLIAAGGVALARRLMLAAARPEIGERRALLFLTVLFGSLVFRGLWPVFTAQNALPLEPGLVLFGSALAFLALRRPRTRRAAIIACMLVGATCVAILLERAPPWRDDADADRKVRSLVLALTPPDGYVMDAKGEAVFRRRPVQPVLETFTLTRYRLGLLHNDIAERLAATGTAVVIADRVGVDEPTRRFLARNYLDVGSRVLVAGRVLALPSSGGAIAFDIEVPSVYAVQSGDRARLTIDGREVVGPVVLGSGTHRLDAGAGQGPVTLLYAPAAEQGLTPAAPTVESAEFAMDAPQFSS